jgi:hypothetical protein
MFKLFFQTATSTCQCMRAGVAQGGIISVTKVMTFAIWQFTSKAETFTLNFQPSPLVNTVTWQSHAKNHSDSSTTTSWIHWMWWLQNNVSGLCYCSVCRLWETKHPTCGSLPQKYGVTTTWPISWSSQTQYVTAFFVANFSSTKSCGSSEWQKRSTSSSQSSHAVNSSVSWVVKSESHML